MPKITVIAESDYQILFDDMKPAESIPGGTLLNVAIHLREMGNSVAMVSEVGNDIVGNIIIDQLDKKGIETRSIDRSVDISTPATLVFRSPGERRTMRYNSQFAPGEGLDVVWPEISAGDIVIFGGFLAVNQRVRRNLWQLLTSLKERKAIMVYFPGFDPTRIPRITKVMPMIFENLEIADYVVTRTRDIEYIFQKNDAAAAYKNHFSFYGVTYLNIDKSGNTASLFRKDSVTSVTIDGNDNQNLSIANAINDFIINK